MPGKLSDEVREQVIAAMMDGVVDSLSPDAIKEVLSGALREALKDWEVHRAVDKAVEDIAKREMSAYLQKPEVIERIRMESIAAVEKVLTQLPLALADILLRGLMGYSSYGGKGDTDFTKALRRYIGIPEEK